MSNYTTDGPRWVQRKFFDLPLGARFRYMDGKEVYVVLESFDCGKVAQYIPFDGNRTFQGIYTFADSESECRTADVMALDDAAVPAIPAPAQPVDGDLRDLAQHFADAFSCNASVTISAAASGKLFDAMTTSLAEPVQAMPTARTLTKAEIMKLWDDHIVPVFGNNGINPVVFAQAIERHLSGAAPAEGGE